jgi:hypothetical protein
MACFMSRGSNQHWSRQAIGAKAKHKGRWQSNYAKLSEETE